MKEIQFAFRFLRRRTIDVRRHTKFSNENAETSFNYVSSIINDQFAINFRRNINAKIDFSPDLPRNCLPFLLFVCSDSMLILCEKKNTIYCDRIQRTHKIII